MSANKKIDEASVASMVNGFLTNQKSNALKNKKAGVAKKSEAFWKVVAEGLIREAAPRKDADEPDDWRQKFEAPTKGTSNISDLEDEEGSFSSKDEPEKELERTKRGKKDEQGEVIKTQGRTPISAEQLGKKVEASLQMMQKRDPEKYKQFEAMSPEQKRSFRIELGKKIRGQEGVRVEKGSKNVAKSPAAQEKRREVVSGLLDKTLERLGEFAGNPSMIDPQLAAFAKRFFGLDVKNPSVAASVLEKYKSASPEQKSQLTNAITTKALNTPDTAANLVKFMNSRLDMYPHEWMDQTEEFANKQNIPSAVEDKDSGLGFGLKRLGDEAGESSTTKRTNNKGAAGQKRAEELQNQLKNLGREDLQNKAVGRKHIGDSAVHRLFKTSPIEDVVRYADYFTQNPQEIERAKEERRNPPPSSLDDLMGKIPTVGDETEFQKAEIGGEDAKANMVGPLDLKAAKKDHASKLAKFKGGQENIASAEKEAGGQKGKFVNPAGMDYEKPFDLDYKDIFKNLTNIGTIDEPTPKIPGLTSKLVKDIANKLNLTAKKTSGEQRVSPEEVMDVLRKLSQYDDKKRYKGLSSDLQGLLAPEEQWVGKELVRIFNPKRMSKEPPQGELYNLPKAFSDYAGSELEKLVANVPAQQKAIEDERKRQELEKQEKERKLQAHKSSAISPDKAEEMDSERIKSREKLAGGIKNRIEEIPREKKQADFTANTIMGDRSGWEQLKRDEESLAKDKASDPGAYVKPKVSPDAPVDEDELMTKVNKSIERLKASNPQKYATFAKMSPEEQQKFKQSVFQKEKMKYLEKNASTKSPYQLHKDVTRAHEIEAKRRSPKKMKGKQLSLTRALKAGTAKDPGAATKELDKVSSALPFAARAKELGNIDPKAAYVPSPLGPTKTPGKSDLSKKPMNLPQRPYQTHGGDVSGGKMKTRIAGPETADRIMGIRMRDPKQSQQMSAMAPHEKEKMTQDIAGSEVPDMPGTAQNPIGDINFKYGQEPGESFQKRLVTNLMRDARKKLGAAGMKLSGKTMMQYIMHNFEKGKYGKEYEPVKDLILKKGQEFLRPSEMTEGKSMKIKKLSLLELLSMIDDTTKLKHAEAEEDPWENAKPEKKMNFTPKFNKQKKVGK